MRLAYNVLWIENEQEWLEASIDFAQEIVEDNGFELKCVSKSSEAEIEEMLGDEEPLKDFDLILVDFQLDRGERGNKIIENIRSHRIFTEVLFYSQDSEGVRQAIKDHWLDGIYCSSRNRDEFQDKFERVFKTTVKKIQDISTMRGLVLSETSQLDNIIEEIIIDFFSNRDEDDQLKLKKFIVKNCIKKSHRSNSNQIESLSEEIDSLDLVKHRLFDAHKKMRATGKIIEIIKSSEVIDKASFVSQYSEEVIQMRNDLAHANEGIENGIRVLKTINGNKEFNEGECISIRNNLKKHLDYLQNIKKSITN